MVVVAGRCRWRMGAVARAAPSLPFYYYHIPSATFVDFPMVDFLAAADGLIPNLAGIKPRSHHRGTHDGHETRRHQPPPTHTQSRARRAPQKTSFLVMRSGELARMEEVRATLRETSRVLPPLAFVRL